MILLWTSVILGSTTLILIVALVCPDGTIRWLRETGASTQRIALRAGP